MKVGITAEAPGAEINSSLEAFGRVAPKASFMTPPCPLNIREYVHVGEEV